MAICVASFFSLCVWVIFCLAWHSTFCCKLDILVKLLCQLWGTDPPAHSPPGLVAVVCLCICLVIGCIVTSLSLAAWSLWHCSSESPARGMCTVTWDISGFRELSLTVLSLTSLLSFLPLFSITGHVSTPSCWLYYFLRLPGAPVAPQSNPVEFGQGWSSSSVSEFVLTPGGLLLGIFPHSSLW